MYATADVAKFQDYVLALFAAQSRYTFATTPSEPLPEMLAQATTWRDILIADAHALVARGHLSAAPLKELTGSHGYKNVAFDLAGLSSMFKGAWGSLEGKTGLTMSQLQEADKTSLKLAAALAHREQSPERVAAATDIRQRMYTLRHKTYDELRRAVIFLRWHEGDADSIIPSLYAGRGNSNVVRKNNGNSEPQTAPSAPLTETPVQPASPTQATPTTEVAKVPGGHPGSDPLMSV